VENLLVIKEADTEFRYACGHTLSGCCGRPVVADLNFRLFLLWFVMFV
jgi:hypothetical protein